jgi:tetratricopeptide (TPR) repeat protein
MGALAAAAGISLTRRIQASQAVVLAHGAASSSISEDGELRLPVDGGALSAHISERTFKSELGVATPLTAADAIYSGDQIATLSGLNPAQLRTLALYDVLTPSESRFSYTDLAAARAIGRLFAAGVKFAKIVAAAHALERRGVSLSSVRLAEAPWGELLQDLEGRLARLDGQLLLPFDSDNLDADAAFARAEASERSGELEEARRWYDVARRLDPEDAVIRFNLGNVLDELGRHGEAEIAYTQAIERSPDLADAWFNLGLLQEKLGRAAEALSSYRRAFAIEPTYADALHNAALLMMRMRRFAEALRLLEQLPAISPAGAAEAKRLALLCRLELKQGAEGA